MEGVLTMNMGNNTDMMNMTMDMSSSSMMEMTFYNDHHYKFFFDSWDFDTETKYSGGIVALICVSFAIQMVSFLSLMLARWARSEEAGVVKGVWWVLTFCLVYVEVMFSYLMMLAIMSYSTGVFFGIVSGLALGRFVFFYAMAPSPPDHKVTEEEQPFNKSRVS